MPSIKDYNRKLASLRNTTKITKTMKMVSASKLRRAQDSQRQAQAYAREINHLIYRLAGSVEAGVHPLLSPRESVQRILLVVFTSDKGLCGGFNNNIIRYVSQWIADHPDQEIDLSFCGRRGFLALQSSKKVVKHYEGITAKPGAREASDMAADLCESFLKGEYDEIYLVYNEFVSALSQHPVMSRLVPMEAGEIGAGGEDAAAATEDFIAEPEISSLIAHLIPRLVVFKVFYALLENAAGEHGARMTAMDNATTNAFNLIDRYTLLRNRARQAAITTELIEIISGAEAL
jgi:F-type H+-transporting ATPase subunit gamma